MTTTTATKPAAKAKATKPAKPAPEAKAPANPTPAPQAPIAREPRVNSAYADEAVRSKITQAMADLDDKGFTRGELAAHMGLTKGAVWRLQNDKAHSAEIAIVEEFITRVLNGEVTATVRPKAPNASELKERVAKAVEVLQGHNAQKSITNLRKLVNEAIGTLTA